MAQVSPPGNAAWIDITARLFLRSTVMMTLDTENFDLKRLPAGFIDDPFPYYHALREHDPVHRMPDGSYFLSRYEDCDTVYRDPATWSSDKKVDFKPNFSDTDSIFLNNINSR